MNEMDSEELNASSDHRLTTDDSEVSVQMLTDRGQSDHVHSNSSNVSSVDSFFNVYYSQTRFTAETVIAMISAGVNAAVLTTLVVGGRCWAQHGHHTKTVYRCLFTNLAAADCLTSVSMWLGNNLAYLFGEQLASMNVCLSIICLSAAFFISSAFSLAAMMTVLGFAVVQYFSICHPLQNMTVVSTKKVGTALFIISAVEARSALVHHSGLKCLKTNAIVLLDKADALFNSAIALAFKLVAPGTPIFIYAWLADPIVQIVKFTTQNLVKTSCAGGRHNMPRPL